MVVWRSGCLLFNDLGHKRFLQASASQMCRPLQEWKRTITTSGVLAERRAKISGCSVEGWKNMEGLTQECLYDLTDDYEISVVQC